MHILLSLLLLISAAIFPSPSFAADINVVTPVFPLRERQYWRQGKDLTYLTDITALVDRYHLPATFLLHYDVLKDAQVVDHLKSKPDLELGLFLEVTRTLAEDSLVVYDWDSGHWSAANRLFTSAYLPWERYRLIDHAFASFKHTFGRYPASIGAWHIDNTALAYIKEKYGLNVYVGLSDQYSTDGYQVWGQYINQPYLISRNRSVEPALDAADSLGVIRLQWAPRHPLLFYSLDKDASNYSLQVNDYSRALSLPHDHFISLLKNQTVDLPGRLSQVVVGIEIAELQPEYLPELEQQFIGLTATPGLTLSTVSGFGPIFFSALGNVNQTQVVSASHGDITAYWFQSPLYRALVTVSPQAVTFQDLRFYHQNGLRDNEDFLEDPYPNLHRLVPAVIDGVALNNSIHLTSHSPSVTASSSDLSLVWPDGGLSFSSSTVTATGSAAIALSGIPLTHQPQSVSSSAHLTVAGSYPRLRQFISRLYSYLPDLRFSRVDGNFIIGIRYADEKLFGLAFPRLKFGSFTYAYADLSRFISLKEKFKPRLHYRGKQEYELNQAQKSGTVITKDSPYGQKHLLEAKPGDILFENSYYYVVKN